MVGLSVVLEEHKDITTKTHEYHHHQVISKASMIKSSISASSPTPPSSPSPLSRTKKPFDLSSYSSTSGSSSGGPAKRGFLDHCFLCKQKLLPGKDIYMYKGDRAFCSEECRRRQIFMDEEEVMIKAKTDHCSLAASSSTSTRKGAKNHANGFAY